MIHDVLVTGASGFVGGHIVGELNRRGIQPIVLLRKSSRLSGIEGASYRVAWGSLADLSSLQEAVQGVDAVIHVAGIVSAASRDQFFEHNAEGTRRLLEAIESHAPNLKRFLYVSSLAAAGPTLGSSPRTEMDQAHLVSAYGESKSVAEKYVLQAAERIPSLIVRPPLVFGPNDRGVLSIVRTAARGWMALLPSEPRVPQKLYSYIYGEDLAAAIVEMTLSQVSGWKSGDVFFLSSPEVVTQEQIYAVIGSVLGKKLKKIRVPAWLVRGLAHVLNGLSHFSGKTYPLNVDKLPELLAPAWTCSPARAKKVFGVEAKTSFEAGMIKTVQWYLSKGWIR